MKQVLLALNVLWCTLGFAHVLGFFPPGRSAVNLGALIPLTVYGATAWSFAFGGAQRALKTFVVIGNWLIFLLGVVLVVLLSSRSNASRAGIGALAAVTVLLPGLNCVALAKWR